MPSHMLVVGFARLVSHPNEDRSRLTPTYRANEKLCLRPHDVIALALMVGAGMEFMELPVHGELHASFFSFEDGEFKDSYNAAQES